MQFEYQDYVVNLLDTPGHHDFSEDTYRVLMAVDAVIMVIDAAKGIEAQTRKLFEICRLRGIPIFTFINKLDRPAKDPLALLDEIETTLQIGVCAINWPMGDGQDFRGVYDRQQNLAHFSSARWAAPIAPRSPAFHSGPAGARAPASRRIPALVENIEMLAAAGKPDPAPSAPAI